MTTIYDIAEKTGLSVSTVARALNGNGYCSNKARKRILAAAEEMGYVPHQAAKTLKNSITNKIMLCIPDIMNPYYFDMIKGITETLEEYHYNILLSYTMHNPQKELNILNSLKGRYVDGLIFCSFDYTPELIQAIKDTGLPAAITSFYENSGSDRFYDCIYASQPRAAWCATKHCIEMGHTRIAFLGGDPKEQNTRERFEGYRQAMEEAGLAVEMDLVIYADFTRAGASHQFQQFIMENGQCTAVVACNDLMAIGCMNACGTLGLKVPENISIVSLDNTEYCLCTNPLITSVDMMQNQVGTEAVKLIMDRIINKRCYRKDLVFSPNIIRRDSVKQLMPMKK